MIPDGIIQTAFKKTEIGEIPNEWECDLIDNLLKEDKILSHLDGNHGQLYPKSSEFVSEGIPYISANNFLNGEVDFSQCKFLTIERALKFKKGVAINGDVLFAHNATVGPVALLKTKLDYVILSTTATYYRCNTEYISNIYWKYFLQSSSFVNQYKRVMSQSTRNQVPITTQRSFYAIIPPLPEQKKMSSILSSVDDAIQATQKVIDQTEKVKQGLLQELLTKGIGHTEFKKTEIGEIPVEWEISLIQNLLDEEKIIDHLDGNHGQLYPKSSEFITEGIPYISANNFLNGEVEFNKCKFLSKERALKFKKGVAKDGDVLFAHNATVGPVAILKTDLEYVILSTTATYYRCNPLHIDNFYWMYFLQSSLFVNQYTRVMSQSTRNQVPITTQRTFFAVLPSISEQKQIASILSETDSSLKKSREYLMELKHVKKGLMQDLLTGKVRVEVEK